MLRGEPKTRIGRASGGGGWPADRVLPVVLASLMVVALAVGCSGVGASESKQLKLGVLPWDENVAISSLTKVILEDDLGYDSVEFQNLKVPEVFEGVGSGELDAFQDVWLPNHDELLEEVRANVDHLPTWYEGETAFGITVPYYMDDVRSIADLDDAGTDLIIGLEPDSPIHAQIKNEVIPAYALDIKLVESDTPTMISELDKAYEMREPIVFLGWSPHWMNAKYRFRYLEDPKDALGPFNDPSQLSSIVRKDLKKDDPMAYEFLSAISLSEGQVNELEAEINEAGDPEEGARNWVANNRDYVQPWIDAAETTEES